MLPSIIDDTAFIERLEACAGVDPGVAVLARVVARLVHGGIRAWVENVARENPVGVGASESDAATGWDCEETLAIVVGVLEEEGRVHSARRHVTGVEG